MADLPTLVEQNQALAARVERLEDELIQLRRRTLDISQLFSPAGILIFSLGVMLAFAALVILDRELSLSTDRYRFFLIYMVPIGAPFTAYLLDRSANWSIYRMGQWIMEVPLLLLAFTRAFYHVPFISGHALFLSYALLTVRSRVAQTLALLVLLEVVYFKVFAWHDPTIYGGALLGALAALISRRFCVRKAHSGL